MAIQVIREVSADVIKRGSTKAVYAKQSDYNSRFLDIRIQEDGHDIEVDSTSQVILNVERPDKLENMFYGTVNENGTVRVPLTSWMLELAGTLICDVSVVSQDVSVAKLTTMVFNIYVEEAVIADGSFEETENYSLIIDLLDRTSAAEEQASKAAADAQYVKEQCEEATENAKNFTKIDPTLTQLGYSADAQSTGAAINALDKKVQEQLSGKSNKTHAHNATDVYVVGDVLSRYDLYPGNVEAAINESFLYFVEQLKNKAPAGFGLGSSGTLITQDLDTVYGNGFYYWETAVPNAPFDWGYLLNIQSYGEGTTQIAFSVLDQTKMVIRRKTANKWGTWVNCDPSAFAPSGYGLGTTSREINSVVELDSLVVNCNFLFAGADDSINIGNVYNVRYCYGRVDAYDGSSRCKQTIIPVVPALNSTLVRYKSPDLGGWSEWEWVNPPMALGVEYRTTERSNGRPIYTKFVDCGKGPTGGAINLYPVASGSIVYTELACVAYTAGGYGIVLDNYLNFFGHPSADITVSLIYGKDLSEYNIYLTVKYYKV